MLDWLSKAQLTASIFLIGLAAFTAPASAAPVQHSWKAADSGLWDDNTKWKPKSVPNGANDAATIDIAGNPYSVTLNIDATLANFALNAANATFVMNKTLTIDKAADLLSGSVLMNDESVWAGKGAVTNRTTMTVVGGALIENPFVQQGRIFVEGMTKQNSTLNLSKSVTNTGTITLHSVASEKDADEPTGRAFLAVKDPSLGPFEKGEPILTNAPGALIILEGSGTSGIFGGVLNEGTVQITTNAEITPGNGVGFQNNGIVELAPKKTITLTGMLGSGSFSQVAGELRLGGNLTINNSNFNYFGGKITGAGEVFLNNSNLVLGTNGPNGPGAGDFVMSGDGKITGFDLATKKPTVARISRTQLVTLRATKNGDGNFTAPNGLINNGFLQLTSTAATGTVLDLQSGTLINNSKLIFGSGAGGGRSLDGTLKNNGNVEVFADTTIGSPNAKSVNTGVIVISGATLSLVGKSFKNMNGGSISAKGDKAVNVEDLADKKLVNAGTIDFGSGIGLLGITGGYEQDATGTLAIELARQATGTQTDILDVSGPAELAGAVSVELAPGSLPLEVGDEFVILTSDALSGAFDRIFDPPGAIFSAAYGYSPISELYDVTLRVDQLKAVPEPRSITLLGVGAVLFGLFRRFRKVPEILSI